jgi:hypothetical protein
VKQRFGEGPRPPYWLLLLNSQVFWQGVAIGALLAYIFLVIGVIITSIF